MGNAGGSFGQSFAQTLLQGHQIIEQVKARREDLELKKKLADVEFKAHELKTEAATRKIAGIDSFRSRLQPQYGEEEGAGMQPAAPLSAQEWQKFGLEIDPDEVVKQGLRGSVDRASATDFDSLVEKYIGGGGSTAPAQPAPAAPAEAPLAEAPVPSGPAPSPAAPAPAGRGTQGAVSKEMTLSFGEDGKRRLSIKVGNVNYDIKHVTIKGADGRAQIWRVASNPQDVNDVKMAPVGPAMPPEETQKWMQAVESLGLKPGTDLHEAAVADFQFIANTMQGPARDIMMAQTEQYYRSQATARPASATAPAKPTAAGARAQAKAEEVEQGARKAAADVIATTGPAAAKKKAEQEAVLSVPERASGEERKRLEANLTTIDQYNQISATYKPEYVGPVRKTLGMVSGGPVASLRQRTGIMSQQEQQFRTNIAIANNDLVREMSGANVPPSEMARVAKQLPDPDALPPKQFEARMDAAKLYAKAVGVRRRQVLEATGVDVSKMPKVSLTTEDRRKLAEPILVEYLKRQITREEAVEQLMGLSGYGEPGAHAYLTAGSGGKR